MSNLLSKKSWHVQSARNRERVRRDEEKDKEKRQYEEKKRKKDESQQALESFKRVKPSISDHQQLSVVDLSSNLIQTNSEVEDKILSSSKQVVEGVSFKSALKYDHQSRFHKVVNNSKNNTSPPIPSEKKHVAPTEKDTTEKKKESKLPPPSMDDLLKEYQARNAIETAKTKALLEQSKKNKK
ncbi:hypothetical protein FDP41_003158 [Naegleria fowleri]|uniref:CBF1-interacting co-repressor CIR N-terminal domain-containing protein n=1 Tax=Naegleria fowleri TaxID=5763 RepID=A0A6A5BRR4_NAEFO|nr:uncharacterized protein FDP41_003158 [Naegleria fowleri]KAF0977836.1 hypothetical protein FDP41_003158 [Naegleria fowleri]